MLAAFAKESSYKIEKNPHYTDGVSYLDLPDHPETNRSNSSSISIDKVSWNRTIVCSSITASSSPRLCWQWLRDRVPSDMPLSHFQHSYIPSKGIISQENKHSKITKYPSNNYASSWIKSR